MTMMDGGLKMESMDNLKQTAMFLDQPYMFSGFGQQPHIQQLLTANTTTNAASMFGLNGAMTTNASASENDALTSLGSITNPHQVQMQKKPLMGGLGLQNNNNEINGGGNPSGCSVGGGHRSLANDDDRVKRPMNAFMVSLVL